MTELLMSPLYEWYKLVISLLPPLIPIWFIVWGFAGLLVGLWCAVEDEAGFLCIITSGLFLCLIAMALACVVGLFIILGLPFLLPIILVMKIIHHLKRKWLN